MSVDPIFCSRSERRKFSLFIFGLVSLAFAYLTATDSFSLGDSSSYSLDKVIVLFNCFTKLLNCSSDMLNC